MAELVDAHDSKSCGLWSCGFDSHHKHHEDLMRTQKSSLTEAPLQYSEVGFYDALKKEDQI